MYTGVMVNDKKSILTLTCSIDGTREPIFIGEYNCGDIMYGFFMNIYNAIMADNRKFSPYEYNNLTGLNFKNIFFSDTAALKDVFQQFSYEDFSEIADTFDMLRESIRIQTTAFNLMKSMEDSIRKEAEMFSYKKYMESNGAIEIPVELMPHNILAKPAILYMKDHVASIYEAIESPDNIITIDGTAWFVRPREYCSYFIIDENLRTHQVYKVEGISELVSLDYLLYYTRINPTGAVKFCRRCNKPFKSERSDALYCSNLCASQFKNQVNDDYERKFRYLRKRTSELYPTRTKDKEYSVRREWLKISKVLLADIQSGKIEMTPEEYAQRIKNSFEELYKKNDLHYHKEL